MHSARTATRAPDAGRLTHGLAAKKSGGGVAMQIVWIEASEALKSGVTCTTHSL